MGSAERLGLSGEPAILIDFVGSDRAMIGDAKCAADRVARLQQQRRDGDVGIAAVELVEVGLEIRNILVVRRDARLVVVMPRGEAVIVLRWGSAAVARRFASAVVAAVVARYPETIASALGPASG